MNVISLHHTRNQRHLPVDIFSGLEKRDQFKLLEPLMVQLPCGNYLAIEQGFVSDGASVPPWLWSIFPPYDNVVQTAYVVHDYLYENWEKSGLSADDARKHSDQVMLRLCLQYDTGKTLKHILFYLACRIRGVKNWNRFRERYALQNPLFKDN